MSNAPSNQSQYILVNISIPILLNENGTYDQYPDHIQVSYTPIESLPVVQTEPNYELNLADYFGKSELSTELIEDASLSVDVVPSTNTTEEFTPVMVSPILDLLTTVSEKKYLEIVNKTKSKIHKSNTTFRCKIPHSRCGEFTRKSWKYLCKVNE